MFKRIYKRIKWRLIVDLREKLNPFFAEKRRKKLKGTDFTIISNNCWGAHVYRYFGLQYQSPTVGLYFFPKEYLKFLSNLSYYLTRAKLEILPSYLDSKYSEILESKKQQNCPIGLLDDVEIVFLHYHSGEEAIDKWNRRCKKVNLNKIIVKNSMQNGMIEDEIKSFDKLEYDNKFIFVPKYIENINSAVVYTNAENANEVTDDILYFNKDVNLVKLINRLYE